MEETFSKGDLLHIPQSVLLWQLTVRGRSASMHTKKPLTGIYVGTLAQVSREQPNFPTSSLASLIFLNGDYWSVRTSDLFLYTTPTRTIKQKATRQRC